MSTLKTNRIENLTTTDGGISINNSGKVGIGTTSPAQLLDIASTAPNIRFTDTVDGHSEIDGNAANLKFNADKGNAKANSNISFAVDNTERMRIDSSGNVGIGATSPSNMLHIEGSSPSIRLKVTSGPRHMISPFSGDLYIESDPDNTSASTNTIFTVDGTERMRIDSSGRLGIGATSPSNPLSVYHATINNVALFESGDANCEIAIADNSGRVAIGNAGDNLRFLTSSSGTERARIDSSGRLLINTTSTSGGTSSDEKLVVNGGIRSYLESSSGNTTFTPNYTFSDGLYAIAYRVSGQNRGFVGYVSCINGSATVTTLTNIGTSAPSVVSGPKIRFPIPGGNYGKNVSITLITGL